MVDKKRIMGSYDRLAEIYAEQRTESDRGMALLSDFIDRFQQEARILDAGCGQGAPVLLEMSKSVSSTGLDFSREQLRLAQTIVPKADLTQGDMTKLPFTANSFDGVVAYWSLIHIPKNEHQKVLNEFARVLQPGGHILLCEGIDEWEGENHDWLNSGVEMQWGIAGTEKTATHLETADFTDINIYGGSSNLKADLNEEDSSDPSWMFFRAQLSR